MDDQLSYLRLEIIIEYFSFRCFGWFASILRGSSRSFVVAILRGCIGSSRCSSGSSIDIQGSRIHCTKRDADILIDMNRIKFGFI